MCATEENEPDSSYDLSIEYHHSSESSQYNTQWVVSQNKSPAGNSGTFVESILVKRSFYFNEFKNPAS